MKKLFDDLSIKFSEITTKKYSTSFSLGIRFLHPKLRKPIYNIYGFVRFADEIVDSFHGFPKKSLLKKFENDTFEAIEDHISLNPILNAFQATVNKYNIDHGLISTFLESMEMDLMQSVYDREQYEKYILGSAEVVGLMCLQVFLHEDPGQYEGLKPFAMRLGAAFQKVNFLRDLKEDQENLGRSYFPELNVRSLRKNDKVRIEEEIEEDFEIALEGIRRLPRSSRRGVHLAYLYYRNLFRKIKTTSADHLMSKRVRISNARKILILLYSYFRPQLH